MNAENRDVHFVMFPDVNLINSSDVGPAFALAIVADVLRIGGLIMAADNRTAS